MSNLFDSPGPCLNAPLSSASGIRQLIQPVKRDLGGFSVRRLLPADTRKAVGPFVFFDHLGPTRFPAGQGIDVRPHPHIGLATVTYLFSGEILHRDSLGNVQPIRPGEINWMTAGRGIAHSERTPPARRMKEHELHALQLWVALPEKLEETEPEFIHFDAPRLPSFTSDNVSIRVLLGAAYGVQSPVPTLSPTLYLEVRMTAGSAFLPPSDAEEIAIYLLSGSLTNHRMQIEPHCLAVLEPSANIRLQALQDSHLVAIGGHPLGHRTVWWNLVASRKELITRAKEAWRKGLFPQIPEETEFIPLPEASS